MIGNYLTIFAIMHLIKFQELDRQSASSVFLTPFDQTQGKPAPNKRTDKLANAVLPLKWKPC